eukprot:scaffold37_cov116-Isochrysis_galbana.AAC.7
MYADYRRCMEALERAINGELTAKRSALAEAARRVEHNVEEVNRAAALMRDETESEHAGVQLSALALDLEAIDAFIPDVAATAAGAAPAAPPPAPAAPAAATADQSSPVAWSAPTAADGAAASAFALLQRQPELLNRASRLAAKPVAAPAHVPSHDLPREEAERNARLQRAEVRRHAGGGRVYAQDRIHSPRAHRGLSRLPPCPTRGPLTTPNPRAHPNNVKQAHPPP